MNGRLVCPLCGHQAHPVAVPPPCPDCAVPLRLELPLPSLRTGQLRGRGQWRYAPFLPPVEPVSLGEGATPLVPSLHIGPRLGVELAYKLEGANPTGSFKDRGAAALVAVLRSCGAQVVADDSSGNAGAALAAYAARARLEAWIFVPAYASDKKLAQIRTYGARTVAVPGPREEATRAALAACATESEVVYASHNRSPYFVAGVKTLAYEIAEDLGWAVPDHLVVPVGGGGLLLGMCQGMGELHRLSWIDRLPQVHAAQALACAPIARAAAAGQPAPTPIQPGDTIAEGVRIATPERGQEVLRALAEFRGTAVAVSEEAIRSAQAELARREGIYVEPTSAVAAAAVAELVAQGHVQPGESVVVPLTGSGLKTPTLS
ncbi:MAG: threonine synthase [Candidatus Bipolaricaulaceae bacterium]